MYATASIVLYKTPVKELRHVYNCLKQSQCISKLYLVDNSPSRELKNIITDDFVEYVYTGNNIGYGAAHNIAIRKTINNADFHVVLNADISFDPSMIKSIVSFLTKHPEVGHLMPKVFYPNGNIQPLCKLIPTPFDMITRGFLPEKWFKKRNRKN